MLNYVTYCIILLAVAWHMNRDHRYPAFLPNKKMRRSSCQALVIQTFIKHFYKRSVTNTRSVCYFRNQLSPIIKSASPKQVMYAVVSFPHLTDLVTSESGDMVWNNPTISVFELYDCWFITMQRIHRIYVCNISSNLKTTLRWLPGVAKLLSLRQHGSASTRVSAGSLPNL